MSKIVMNVDGATVYCDTSDTDPKSPKAVQALEQFKKKLKHNPEWRDPDKFCWVLETFDDIVTVCG